MSAGQHLFAGAVFAGTAFLAFCGASALLGAAVWRMRGRLGLVQVKRLLTALLLLPPAGTLLLVFAPNLPLCDMQMTCHLCWMHQHLGEGSVWSLRFSAWLVSALLVGWMLRLGHRTLLATRILRDLHRFSSPPSEKLQTVLRQVVPVQWHGRFREVEMSASVNGVYGGTCFLSREMVQRLHASEIQAIVAHEWQHLRARDGWLTFVVGLLVHSVGIVWTATYRYWNHAAELLADANAVHAGIRHTELARALLRHQADALGVAVGFAASGSLLEERLRHLLSASNPAPLRCWSWAWWSLIGVGGGGLHYFLWLNSAASTCALHCAFFS